ncbi:hypothetical protein Syun_031245 [Stephania yunnanensis]|uniref:Uncharacterized protein n=1 Tax=Stephania yunnanensis TaxID=152371 RepID=A0AAP0DVF2_9MAGN
MPWQELTNLDLGVDPGQREVVSPRGGMCTVARWTLEHALATMRRQVPRTVLRPPRAVGFGRARLAPDALNGPGHHEASLSVEKHEPRPETWGDQVKVVLERFGNFLVMARGHDQGTSRNGENVARPVARAVG